MITRTEEMLLLVVCKLQDEAHGLTIREEVEALTGKRYSVGGIYVPLERLVRKGFLTASIGQPSEARIGRPPRLYRITGDGVAALRKVRSVQRAMWAAVPDGVAKRLRLT